MNDTQKDKLKNELSLFFINLEESISKALKKERNSKARTKLGELSKACFKIIKTEGFYNCIVNSVDEMTKNEQKSIQLLQLEIEYFNIKCEGEEDGFSTEDGITNGKTVKDSIEKLFSMPKWAKKVLKVLNELLSIVKTLV